MVQKQLQDKARGMLVGLAVGDALGAPVEFGFSAEKINALGDKIENYFDNTRSEAGIWTDDTSMALCLADSLLECGGYDSYDVMAKYYDWMSSGYRAYPGAPLDIGWQTQRALQQFHRDPVVHRNERETKSAGNACIMRLAPIVIANLDPNDAGTPASAPVELLRQAKLSCMETHNSAMAKAVTMTFANALYLAIGGASKQDIMKSCDNWTTRGELKEVKYDIHQQLPQATYDKTGDSLKNLGGYSLDTLLIALWGFMNFESFKDGMLAVIRLGGDTDTNAAVYGQLAGAFYGYAEIPSRWVDELYLEDEIKELADKLLAMESCPILKTRFEGDKDFAKVSDE